MEAVWQVLFVAMAALLLVVLAMLLRTRAWVKRELSQLRSEIASQPSPVQHAPSAPRPAPNLPASDDIDLTALLNGLLRSNQPYNFIESIRALDSRLQLTRLTPQPHQEGWPQDTRLENGGDGLFAYIRGERALLYPNYSRFSATLDPKSLFEGARHGGRIHTVVSPALLEREENGAWLLAQKGRVQMRQGGESI